MMTGLSSFIGKNLVKELGDEFEILSISRKFIGGFPNNVSFLLFEDPNLQEIIRSFEPDIFLNLASNSNNKTFSLNDYKAISEFNISISSFHIDIAIASKVKLIINISSNWAYLSNDSNKDFFNFYAFTKFALDKYLVNASKLSGCRTISLVLYDNFDKLDPREKIFNIILDSITSNTKRKFSPGNQLLNLTRMKDLVSALKYTIKNPWDFNGHKYFQITGNEISIIKLAELIKDSW